MSIRDPNKSVSPPPSGPSALLDRWARAHGPALRAFFLKRTKSPVDADDLVQDVFIRLARRSDLSTIDNIEKYLFQAARNALADRYRHDEVRAKKAHEGFDEDTHGVAGITPETVLLDKEAYQELVSALHELPTVIRDIYVLYHFENIKQTEISKRLRIPLRTVERHMAKANTHILMRLGRRG